MSTQAAVAFPVGTLGGLCNRTTCRAPNAVWFNHSTGAHYCESCATRINRANPDAVALYGHELCTCVEPVPAASESS